MSHTRIWIHAVWSTKNREPMLKKSIRSKVFHHILANAKEMHLSIDTINGVSDHLHALIKLHPDQSIAWVMQLIKGEASHWINQYCKISHRFQWQEEYYAVSVSESAVNRVRKYIRRQGIHHRRKSSASEEARMMASADIRDEA